MTNVNAKMQDKMFTMEYGEEAKRECNFLYMNREERSQGYVTPVVCVCYKEIGGAIYFGISRCSEEDNFCRETGRKLAFERMKDAANELHTSKESGFQKTDQMIVGGKFTEESLREEAAKRATSLIEGIFDSWFSQDIVDNISELAYNRIIQMNINDVKSTLIRILFTS